MSLGKVVQTLIIVPSALLLLWSQCANSFTAGSLVGLVLFGGIIALTALYRQVFALVKRLWSKALGRAAVALVGAVVLFGAGALTYINVQMLSHAERPAEELRCVIVLGCRVRGETPSSMLWVRTRAAYEALSANPEAVVIVSGGQGAGEDITEAEAMRRLLREWGIAEERIYKEETSTSTAENMENSAEILEELGITDGIAISTSEYHQYRASLYAKRSGITVTGSYSGGTARWMLLNCWLREWAGIAAMAVGLN